MCTGTKDFVAPCNCRAYFGYSLENNQNENVNVEVKKNNTNLPSQTTYYSALTEGDRISFNIPHSIILNIELSPISNTFGNFEKHEYLVTKS